MFLFNKELLNNIYFFFKKNKILNKIFILYFIILVSFKFFTLYNGILFFSKNSVFMFYSFIFDWFQFIVYELLDLLCEFFNLIRYIYNILGDYCFIFFLKNNLFFNSRILSEINIRLFIDLISFLKETVDFFIVTKYYYNLILLYFVLFLTIWTRAAGPRFRVDQFLSYIIKNVYVSLLIFVIIIMVIFFN